MMEASKDNLSSNDFQPSLFSDIENNWEKEWKGMPEFISENKKPFQQITISFKCFDDVKDFAHKLGIRVTPKTDALWFPQIEKETGFHYVNKNWSKDEE